jgi:hypothetical protein
MVHWRAQLPITFQKTTAGKRYPEYQMTGSVFSLVIHEAWSLNGSWQICDGHCPAEMRIKYDQL